MSVHIPIACFAGTSVQEVINFAEQVARDLESEISGACDAQTPCPIVAAQVTRFNVVSGNRRKMLNLEVMYVTSVRVSKLILLRIQGSTGSLVTPVVKLVHPRCAHR